MSAIAATIAWHISRVVRRRQPGDAAAYVASRFLVLAFFGGSAAVLLAQGTDMHLHHLYLGERGSGLNHDVRVWDNPCSPYRTTPSSSWLPQAGRWHSGRSSITRFPP